MHDPNPNKQARIHNPNPNTQILCVLSCIILLRWSAAAGHSMMTVAEFAHPQEKGEGRDMGFTKNQLLTRLKELQIDFYQYEHPVVLTVEAQANPPVGKDHPPVLAALVPSDSVSLSDPLENATPLHVPAANPISDEKFTAATGVSKLKATKPPGVAQDCKDNGASKSKDKPANGAHQRGAVSDVGQFVEEILEKASALLLSEITDNTIRQHGKHLGTKVSDCIVKRLGPDLKSLATMFKNTTYTQGFYAGARHQPKRL